MGIFGSIFKSIVETATNGDADKVYSFSYAGFYDNYRFRCCFVDEGSPTDGSLLIKQVCAFGLMRLIQNNELAEYKDDYISAIADRMQSSTAEIARCIQEGEKIHSGVREIVKFIDLRFDCDYLVRATVQVEADSGHRVTMDVRFPSELFCVSRHSLSRCAYVPGFKMPSSY